MYFTVSRPKRNPRRSAAIPTRAGEHSHPERESITGNDARDGTNLRSATRATDEADDGAIADA